MEKRRSILELEFIGAELVSRGIKIIYVKSVLSSLSWLLIRVGNYVIKLQVRGMASYRKRQKKSGTVVVYAEHRRRQNLFGFLRPHRVELHS